MWILYAFGSAFFAGITSILAKIGIQKTDSTLATALRTVVVLVFSWLMVGIVGSAGQTAAISTKSYCFLALSGLATGASWLCYFRALQLGDVSRVVPVDKSSIILTILLAILVFGETDALAVKLAGVCLIGAGTFFMIEKKNPGSGASDRRWLLYAALSAVFAALTSILGKLGVADVESNLATALRTIVVLAMSWVMVAVTGRRGANGGAPGISARIRAIPRRELLFIGLSGLATGASWLCYYKALRDGLASVVVPIDKLSIVVTVAFSTLVLHERLSARAIIGLLLIVAGTLGMVFFA